MRKTPMVGLGLLILIAINTSLSQASGFNQEIGIKINEAYCWKVKRSIDREKTWIDQYFIGHYITAIQNTKNNQTQIFGLLLSSTQAGFWENVHEEDQLAQVSARPTIPQILQSSYLPNMTQVHTYQDILNQEVKELYSEDSNVTTWESNPFQIEINLKYGNGTETRVWIRYDYNGVKRHQTTEIRTSNDTGEIGFEFIDIFAYTPKQMVSMEDLVNLDEIDSTILRFRNNFSITEGFILLSVIGLIVSLSVILKTSKHRYRLSNQPIIESSTRKFKKLIKNCTLGDSRKNSNNILKAWLMVGIILGSSEGTLILLESMNLLPEPYEWGNRNEIALKFNGCTKLFQENEDKIKIVIMGDSHAQTGIDAVAIDRLFKNRTVTYNLAINGTEIIYESLFIMDLIIPKLKPDIIIWDFSPSDFMSFNESELRLNETVRNSIGRVYWEERDLLTKLPAEELIDFFLMKYSHIYRYKTLLAPNFINSSYIDKRGLQLEIDRNQGSNYLYATTKLLPGPIQRVENSFFDDGRKEIFLQALDLIRENKIALYFSHQPFYHKTKNNSKFDELLLLDQCPSLENRIDMRWNYSFINNNKLFSDAHHFNIEGMALYTQIVVNKIEMALNSLQTQKEQRFIAESLLYKY